MTEQEYIYVRDLSNLIAVEKLLRDMNPEHNGIPIEPYRETVKNICAWKEILFSKIKIK